MNKNKRRIHLQLLREDLLDNLGFDGYQVITFELWGENTRTLKPKIEEIVSMICKSDGFMEVRLDNPNKGSTSTDRGSDITQSIAKTYDT